MSKYLEYMMHFSQMDLRRYLGENIVDMLVEWLPKGESSLTKQRLINMIDAIYGASILKNKDFRKDILLCMKPEDIYMIRDICLTGQDKKEEDLIEIVNCIVSKPWGKNKTTEYLMELWNVPKSILEKNAEDEFNDDIIEAPNEQFYELLDYQYYIKQRILNNLNSKYLLERMLVHLPTGTGKTKTTMHAITNYLNFTLKKQGLVIWVAHTKELLEQAYETFKSVWSHLGDGDIKAYKLWSSNTITDIDEELNGVVFCGLAKLMSIADRNKELYERLKKDCRLLVFDEAHKAAANKTRNIIEEFMRLPNGYKDRSLIGLTATPGRTTFDTADNNILSNMFGNKLIYIDSDILNQINYGKLASLNKTAETNIIKYFQERNILAKIKTERLDYNKNFSQEELVVLGKELSGMGYTEKDFTKEQLKVFAENKDRNLKILSKIRELSVDKIPTIIFACSVEHAKILSAFLTLEGIRNSLVIGDMNPAERKTAIDQFKDKDSDVNFIINYEVLTTGFDSKNIKCVFITRPTKSIILYSQMLGRGLRGPLMGGNEQCILIDIDDNLKMFDNETAFSHFNDYWKI